MGWFTVVAYFGASLLCLKAFALEKRGPKRPLTETIPALFRVFKKHRMRPPPPAQRAGGWFALFLIMAALGVNKQLDLQSLGTDLMRVIAYSGGWYGERRLFQLFFVCGMLLVGILLGGILIKLTQGALKPLRLSVLGLVVTMVFVVIRASSFHHVDLLINSYFAGVRMNWLLELAGVSLVGAGAWRRLRFQREE